MAAVKRSPAKAKPVARKAPRQAVKPAAKQAKSAAPVPKSRVKSGGFAASLNALYAAALAYPGAHEDHPWGETVIKVKGKIFLFAGSTEEGGLYAGFKLPASSGAALVFPFASPMGYGLAKSGWIYTRFGPREQVPMPLLIEWLDESYRAVAPKTLVKTLPPAR